jgi:hypothetical protein
VYDLGALLRLAKVGAKGLQQQSLTPKRCTLHSRAATAWDTIEPSASVPHGYLGRWTL